MTQHARSGKYHKCQMIIWNLQHLSWESQSFFQFSTHIFYCWLLVCAMLASSPELRKTSIFNDWSNGLPPASWLKVYGWRRPPLLQENHKGAELLALSNNRIFRKNWGSSTSESAVNRKPASSAFLQENEDRWSIPCSPFITFHFKKLKYLHPAVSPPAYCPRFWLLCCSLHNEKWILRISDLTWLEKKYFDLDWLSYKSH